jgi:putative ABC transport system permease protein
MAATNQTVLRLLWSRFAWRHWWLSPVSSALLLLILAIGEAAFFSIRLANRAAVAGFQNFTDLVTSQSDGLITAPAGTLSETVLPELRQLLGTRPVNLVPVLETSAVAPSQDEKQTIGARPTFQLLGLDLPALVNLARQQDNGPGWFGANASGQKKESQNGFSPVLRNLFSVFISAALAKHDQLKIGSPLPLVINEHPVNLRVAGIIPANPRQPAAPANLLIMDLPALQQLTDKPGQLDRVEFVLEDGPRRAAQWQQIKKTLESASPPNSPRWLVGAPADRRASAVTMTEAFRLNLTILSLLALLVGLYLVFQGLDGAVVRRRNEISVLRSLGVTSRQIQSAWVVEAASIGLAGGLLGLGLGWLGAQLAVKMVARTVNALYFASAADSAAFDFNEAGIALVLAVLASTFAGWRPARIAANTPPAQIAMRAGTSNDPGGKFLQRPELGLVLIVFGIFLTWFPPLRLSGGGRLPIAAYVAALCWIFGAGIFAGTLLAGLGRRLHSLKNNSITLRLASSHLRVPSGRHRLLVASLVCAVGMTAGMAILVGSFDTTMRGWIARTFQADLFISSDGAQTASSASRISPATWKQVIAHPAVKRANLVQVMDIKLGGVSTLLVGNQLNFFRDFARPAWVEAPRNDDVFNPDRNAALALASEAFSERFQIHRGDAVQVPTPGGFRRVTVAGIFADYGNERGSLLIEQRHFANWFGNELAASMILALKPGSDAEALRAELRTAHPGLGVFTSSYLRGESMRIFHQTFAVTYALELIGVVVAVAGLAFTMASLLWERRADLNTLRALGMRRQELALAAAWEGALTAAAGVLSGLAVSLALGWLLIYRINKQTFGWTLQTDRPWGQLAALALLVLASATVAGWFVGQWAARLPAEREE